MAALTPQQRERYQMLAAIRNDPSKTLTQQQRQKLRNLEQLRADAGVKSLLTNPMKQVNYGDTGHITKGTGGAGGNNLTPNNPVITKSANRAGAVLTQGEELGRRLLPEVFEGGSGLDRISFTSVDPERVDFEGLNTRFLQPSVDDALAYRDDIGTKYDELLGLRRDKLGGLNAAENAALKQSLFTDIDRERAGAMRNIHRTPGLGAGATFAQRRAIGRDYGDAAIDANRKLLLDNIGIKRQALGDFENTQAGHIAAMGLANSNLAGLRGNQATMKSGIDKLNAENALSADKFNSQGSYLADSFNAGQQSNELAARIGAVSAGTGLLGDERDNIKENRLMKQYMDFIREMDERRAAQMESWLG